MPEPTKTVLRAELHHEGRVGGGGDTAGGEVGHWQFAGTGDHLDEFEGRAEVLRGSVELGFVEDGEGLHLGDDLAHVLDGVNDVAGARLALGANHGGPFRDATKCFAKVLRTADEGCGEGVLVDVVQLIGRRKNFGLVDEVDA